MRTFAIIVTLALSLCLSGCRSLNQSIANQDAVVAQIHEHFNSGNLESIWSGAHPRFQGEWERTSFLRHMRTVREKLGKALSTANTARRFSTAKEKTMVFLVQDTAFEKGRAVETFTLEMEGERATLVSYNVQSKLLEAQK